MEKITKQQLKAIHSAISKKGLKDSKKSIIKEASAERTESTKDLTYQEAQKLLMFLNNDKTSEQQGIDKMIRKLMAMAYDIRWITTYSCVDADQVKTKKNYSQVYEWVKKYGYLKKELKNYSYSELPKLLTQFEQGPYAHFLKKDSQ